MVATVDATDSSAGVLAVINLSNHKVFRLSEFGGIASGLKKTSAGLDILLQGSSPADYTSYGKLWIVHVPTSLLP